ncbi:NAD-dependent epimerase/dehydratase family protein [Candidatus Bathyarchaeota archaeon]|nr:NAD-dependent epimerase/dehydratase family protein [Candidatus Bathyarchaeota archaeon]
MKVGITGQTGFIGSHLTNYLKTKCEITLIPSRRGVFESTDELNKLLENCDAVVHLAGVNRGADDEVYNTNIQLADRLIASLKRTVHKPHLIYTSSTQEGSDTAYGRSKKKARIMLSAWAHEVGAVFTGLIVPNVYGPFCKPFYNSVVATFSHQLAHGEEPEIHDDKAVGFIYVDDLVQIIFNVMVNGVEEELHVAPTHEITVSALLCKLKRFKSTYIDEGVIPDLSDPFDLKLFNVFRSYIEPNHYPVPYELKKDSRGTLFEAVKSLNGGQAFISTTKPGVERGNHYHRRKVERFSVIRGEATVRMRRIGTEQVIEYKLDGERPSYMDIPILYTHSLVNVGNGDLFMHFWSSELYDPEDTDTYPEKVEQGTRNE